MPSSPASARMSSRRSWRKVAMAASKISSGMLSGFAVPSGTIGSGGAVGGGIVTSPSVSSRVPRDAQDDLERALRAGPVLAQQLRTAGAQREAQGQRGHDRVVELAGDRYEVRHEVD